jgi:hypothetical protein
MAGESVSSASDAATYPGPVAALERHRSDQTLRQSSDSTLDPSQNAEIDSKHPGQPAIASDALRFHWTLCTSGTLVPYDIIYDLSLLFTVYDIICIL